MQIEDRIEAVQRRQGPQALPQRRLRRPGAAGGRSAIGAVRQVGAEIELVERQPDAESGPRAQGDGNAAEQARYVDLDIDVGHGDVGRGRLDACLGLEFAQPPGWDLGDVHVEPLQQAAEIVGTGLDLAFEDRGAVARGDGAKHGYGRAARQQGAGLVQGQFAVGELAGNLHLPHHGRVVDHRVGLDLESRGHTGGQREATRRRSLGSAAARSRR